MSERNGDNRQSQTSPEAIRVLEMFSLTAKQSFDRMLAARSIGEAQRAMPGDDWQTWSRRLIEVGESLNLRIRSVESSLNDALTFLGQGTPVATCVETERDELRWVLISEYNGRRVRVIDTTEESSDSWLSVRSLRKLLKLKSVESTCSWVIGQPALACDPPSRDSMQPHAQKHVPPFARLLGLLQPEKKDLWVILIFSAVVGILALATPIAVEALVNTVAFGRYLQPVVVLAILLFTFLAFAAAMRALLTYIVEIIQRRFFVRVVEDLAYRLPRARQRALDGHYGPELANRFFDVVTVQKASASLLLSGISVVLQTLIGMSVLAFYHPFLLGFDVTLILLIAFIIFGLGRGAVATSVKESKAKYAVAAWLQELVRNPTAFKLHSGTQFALEKADQLAIGWLEARRKHFRILIRQILFALGLQAVAATALLGLGGWLVILGELTLGQLVAAELIVMIIVGSFAKLGKHLESFYDLLASIDKLGYLFDLPVEPSDKLFHLRDGLPAKIDVRDVSYKYGSHTVLKNLSVALNPGDTVALWGPSGSGKSTLVDLLCGIRQPSSGHIELDGIDLRELRPDSLREHLAVARSVEIFHGSIDENVHLSRPNISALDVREALDAVGLLDELLIFPEGLNTSLQTGGAPLSSGQAARLMLARAIVGRPRLLLIDGLLDTLPDVTIVEVLENLTKRQSPWTLFVATGRLAVKHACGSSFILTPHASKTGDVKRDKLKEV